jgi:hypothetical protein
MVGVPGPLPLRPGDDSRQAHAHAGKSCRTGGGEGLVATGLPRSSPAIVRTRACHLAANRFGERASIS